MKYVVTFLFVVAGCFFALGFIVGREVGRDEIRIWNYPIALESKEADTVNSHVPGADIGSEILAVNAKALKKANQ